MPTKKKKDIRRELLDELLAGYSKPEDLTGPDGLLKQLTGALVERALQAEMTDHLGYEPHAAEGLLLAGAHYESLLPATPTMSDSRFANRPKKALTAASRRGNELGRADRFESRSLGVPRRTPTEPAGIPRDSQKHTSFNMVLAGFAGDPRCRCRRASRRSFEPPRQSGEPGSRGKVASPRSVIA
jgi:hypothetical protein